MSLAAATPAVAPVPVDLNRWVASSFGGPVDALPDHELDRDIELPDLLPVLDGYDLVGEVGRGGQGVVYRGTERATGRDVAVKILPGGHFPDARARSRFAREIRILSRLAKPNVVSILDHGTARDGSSFLVMPFIEGVPLLQFAAGLGRDDPSIAVLFGRVAEAVDAVHRAGVVHRDLKPDNVRVDADAVPHLLDFGLADSPADKSRALTRSGQVIGTLSWLSPEQAEGRRRAVGPRSDVYALGLMLCRAIADGGAPPYAVDAEFDRAVVQIRESPPVVAGRETSDPLARIALRCLAKRPAGRYRSAAALAADLRRLGRSSA